MLVLQIRGNDIDDDRVTCTGAQVATVLDFIAAVPALAGGDWYAGAVDGLGARLTEYEVLEPIPVPALADLLHRIRNIPQLLDGVFALVPRHEIPRLTGDCFSADGPMEPLIHNALVEIKAFDTSFVEVYTDQPSLITVVQQRFGGEVRKVETQPAT
ncbi:hypothetical protein [Azospirillum sp. B4]|uniref:hypothetical protein n=1 Tax=Azospirillum sp. B4 TaxID=95605 RepID=UPI000349B320|nr:hypothetical protein [Azospirillum sp. B4]